MRAINIEKIVILPERVEVTISISGLLSTFVIYMSFLENKELVDLSLSIAEKIKEIAKSRYLKEELFK